MKVKVSGLTGMALSYTMCMIEMPHLVWEKTIGVHGHSRQIVVPELPEPKCYSPYMGWDMVGPIIEREWLNATPWPNEALENVRWHCQQHDSSGDCVQYGPTLLIAAMRCMVASKLGDEVEIPDELKELT